MGPKQSHVLVNVLGNMRMSPIHLCFIEAGDIDVDFSQALAIFFPSFHVVLGGDGIDIVEDNPGHVRCFRHEVVAMLLMKGDVVVLLRHVDNFTWRCVLLALDVAVGIAIAVVIWAVVGNVGCARAIIFIVIPAAAVFGRIIGLVIGTIVVAIVSFIDMIVVSVCVSIVMADLRMAGPMCIRVVIVACVVVWIVVSVVVNV